MQTQTEEQFFSNADVSQLIDAVRNGVPAFPHFSKQVMLDWLSLYRQADYPLILGSYFGVQVHPSSNECFCATLPYGAAEYDLAEPLGPYRSHADAYKGACEELRLRELFDKRCAAGQSDPRRQDHRR